MTKPGGSLGILLLLMVSLAMTPITTAIWVITALFLLLSLLVAVAFVQFTSPAFWIYLTTAMATFALDSSRFLVYRGAFHEPATILASVLYAILLLIAIVIVLSAVAKQRTVTSDTILGSICAYIMIGLFWFVLYMLVYACNRTSFQGVIGDSDFELIYFSFTTLTTLGHGDIVPTSRITQVLCNLEAITGQMFPAIFISRLVSLWVINEMAEVKK